MYQRGKLDISGVMARLSELLRSCPDFPEARAMLSAAERGSLRPDPRSFNLATVPPPAVEPVPALAGDFELELEPPSSDDRPTRPDPISSDGLTLEARLQVPQAPGIPRAPLLPSFAAPTNLTPSYIPERERMLSPPGIELELDQPPNSDTLSAPPPSSSRGRDDGLAPLAMDLTPQETRGAYVARTTAPSPGAPGPAAAEPPSIFVIATWLAERDFERALAAVEKLGADTSPELTLLEVRALMGMSRKAAARRSLDRLCRAPLLDPELRAGVARLLLELGDVDRAVAQARRAHAEEPASVLCRLTLAWSMARSDAWSPSPGTAAELNDLLGHVAPEATPLPALSYALLALQLLQSSTEAARQAVEAALSLDPDLPDALAIAAVVAQRQARSADANLLYQRLLQLDHHAADELASVLSGPELSRGRGAVPRRGAAPVSVVEAPVEWPPDVTPVVPELEVPPSRPSRPPPPARPSRPPPPARPSGTPSGRGSVRPPRIEPTPGARPWDEKERRLALGDVKAALFDFEQGLSRKLEAIPVRPSAADLARAAMITARHLTEAVVSRHFAPYDFSLFSVARLDTSLHLLYSSGAGPRTELRNRALLGLGAYSGECLRRAYAGDWLGGTELLRMHIEAQGTCFAPFRDMNARLQQGLALEIGDVPVPHHPGAEPYGQRIDLDVTPPTPWDPAPWPEVQLLPDLAATLRETPVGTYCAGIELPLDMSFASLRSLDRYVTLLAPPLAPSDPEGGWLRRAAVVIGAYMGEVLRTTRGGAWEAARGELRAESYRLHLPGDILSLPVMAVSERLSGRRLEQPSDYARRITG